MLLLSPVRFEVSDTAVTAQTAQVWSCFRWRRWREGVLLKSPDWRWVKYRAHCPGPSDFDTAVSCNNPTDKARDTNRDRR